MTDFPRTVNNAPGLAVPGDFYGTFAYASVLSAESQAAAPAEGVTVGNFAWLSSGVSASYVAGAQIGFVHRNLQAVITEFLGESTMVIQEGLPVGLYDQGCFWAKFAAGATVGQRVYADPSTGAPIAGSTTPNAASVTAAAGFRGTGTVGFTGVGTVGFLGTGAMGASFTGEITTNVMTASAVTGYIAQGDVLSGAGITPGTLIGAQLTGTPGAAGTYTVTHADIASEAMVASSLTLRVSAVVRGLLAVGNAVTATGMTGATVVSIDTGTGGVGTYTMTGTAQRVASTATVAALQTTLTIASVTRGLLVVGDTITGTGVTAATTIVAFISGTGGTGTYEVSVAQTVASTTISASQVTMTISAVSQGALQVGSILSGSGVTAATVTAFVSGTGGTGTYTISVAQNVASTTISGTTTVLNVTAVGSGVLGIGSLLSGSGVTSGTVITAQLTGAEGGIGTYTISPAQVFSSTTVTEVSIPTSFYVQSTCSAGELAKISSW